MKSGKINYLWRESIANDFVVHNLQDESDLCLDKSVLGISDVFGERSSFLGEAMASATYELIGSCEFFIVRFHHLDRNIPNTEGCDNPAVSDDLRSKRRDRFLGSVKTFSSPLALVVIGYEQPLLAMRSVCCVTLDSARDFKVFWETKASPS